MLRLCCIGCRNILIGTICLATLCADFASSQAPGNPSEQTQARVKALYAEGMSALRKQDLAGAQATFEKLIRIAPRSPEAHNSLGWVLLNQGQVDSAVEQFRSAIRLKPDFPQAHLNLANALSQRLDFAGAELEARQAIRRPGSHGIPRPPGNRQRDRQARKAVGQVQDETQ